MNKREIKGEILEMVEAMGEIEIRESKKVFFDKNANQFVLKIPKDIALKSELHENSIFNFVLKAEQDKKGLTIFLKNGK